jgi:hypothetical protein
MIVQKYIIKLKISNLKEKERKIFIEFPVISIVIRLRFVEIYYENNCQNLLFIL